jgi:hypothetical protein
MAVVMLQHIWFELRGDGYGGAFGGDVGGAGRVFTGLGLGAADAKASMRETRSAAVIIPILGHSLGSAAPRQL